MLGRNSRFLQSKGSDLAVEQDLIGATLATAVTPCVYELINFRKNGSRFRNQARHCCTTIFFAGTAYQIAPMLQRATTMHLCACYAASD